MSNIVLYIDYKIKPAGWLAGWVGWWEELLVNIQHGTHLPVCTMLESFQTILTNSNNNNNNNNNNTTVVPVM